MNSDPEPDSDENISEPDDIDKMHTPNFRFKNYKPMFENLLKTKVVQTKYPIVSAMILSDSSRTLTVTK